MVKLTRILKNEYRDDVASKRGRRKNRKNVRGPHPSTIRDEPQEPPAHDAAASGRDEVKLPPALLKMLQSQAPGHQQQPKAAIPTTTTATTPTVIATEREEREPAEPASPAVSVENPHHYALTRAAHSALRTMPLPDDAEDHTSDANTMALIDSIVTTADDPALLDTLHSMMGDANTHTNEQRETLALVAESILEKKAAKEALERAVMAESRLHESLKKCAPQLAGNAGAFGSGRSVNAESASTQPHGNHHPQAGFLNFINRSFSIQSHGAGSLRRIPFVKSRSKGSKKSSKSKSSKKDKSMSAPVVPEPEPEPEPELEPEPGLSHEDVLLLETTGTGDVEHPTDEPVFLMSTQPFAPPHAQVPVQVEVQTDGDAEAEVAVLALEDVDDGVVRLIETRDDREATEREVAVTEEEEPEEAEHVPAPTPRRRNKYKHIASTEPEPRFFRSSSRSSRFTYGEQQSTYGSTVDTSTYVNDAAAPTSIIAHVGPTTFVSHEPETFHSKSGTDVSSSAEGNEDGSDSDSDDDGKGEEMVKVEFTGEGEDEPKIEYTIFELESKLSMSTVESSLASRSSVEFSPSEDLEDDDDDLDDEEAGHTTDNETLENEEVVSTFDGGEETGASDAGDDYGATTDDDTYTEEEEDVDDDFLFASFCQRPDASFEEVNDESVRPRRSRRKDRKEKGEATDNLALFKCVSGYFGATDDVEVHRDKKKRRRRRRRHH